MGTRRKMTSGEKHSRIERGKKAALKRRKRRPPGVDKELLARVLVEERLARGMPQEELAERMGITSASLCSSENGYTGLGMDKFGRMCEAIGVRMSDIFREYERRY